MDTNTSSCHFNATGVIEMNITGAAAIAGHTATKANVHISTRMQTISTPSQIQGSTVVFTVFKKFSIQFPLRMALALASAS